MSTAQGVCAHFCETYACLAVTRGVARSAAWVVAAEVAWAATRADAEEVAGDAAKKAAGEAAWGVQWGMAEHVTWLGARGLAWAAASNTAWDVAKEVAMEAARKATKIHSDWKAVGVETARATLRYVITNEEKIYSAIRARLKGVTTAMPNTVDLEKVIDTMTTLDIAKFQEMNLGGKCWYLYRIWCLAAATAERKFFATVKDVDDREGNISRFVNWMAGCRYSCDDFLSAMESLDCLIPPLLMIVYDYLVSPSPDLVRSEILALVEL